MPKRISYVVFILIFLLIFSFSGNSYAMNYNNLFVKSTEFIQSEIDLSSYVTFKQVFTHLQSGLCSIHSNLNSLDFLAQADKGNPPPPPPRSKKDDNQKVQQTDEKKEEKTESKKPAEKSKVDTKKKQPSPSREKDKQEESEDQGNGILNSIKSIFNKVKNSITGIFQKEKVPEAIPRKSDKKVAKAKESTEDKKPVPQPKKPSPEKDVKKSETSEETVTEKQQKPKPPPPSKEKNAQKKPPPEQEKQERQPPPPPKPEVSKSDVVTTKPESAEEKTEAEGTEAEETQDLDEGYVYNSKGKRDPFVSLLESQGEDEDDSEILDVGSLKLVGIVELEKGRLQAMIEDAKNNAYFLSEGDVISGGKGKVVEINKEEIVFEIQEVNNETRKVTKKLNENKEAGERK